MTIRSIVPVFFLLCAALPACGKDNKPAGGTGTAAGAVKIDAAAADEAFKSRCSSCHGESGHGDGPGSAALTPKPRNFGDKEWAKSVTDDHLRKVIVMGGAAVGKSPMMPPAPDLDGKPEVVEGLVKKIRSFSGT